MLEAPQLRYTQGSQTPVAEMEVRFAGLRPDDPPAQIKVVGWGNLAQELPDRVRPGERLVLEGRLRMNTVTRQDGLREKRAEFTLARFHPLAGEAAAAPPAAGAPPARKTGAAPPPPRESAPVWNTSPLVPDDLVEGEDEIPF